MADAIRGECVDFVKNNWDEWKHLTEDSNGKEFSTETDYGASLFVLSFSTCVPFARNEIPFS